MKIRVYILFFIFLQFFLLMFINADDLQMDKINIEIISLFEKKIPGLMGLYNVPGAAVSIVCNGEVFWIKGFGLADRENEKPVEADTVFQVASNSKPVTAWGVMKLFQNGKINIDNPVDTYLTRWNLPSSAYDNAQVTIRRLLSHTSGLSVRGYAGYDPGSLMPSLEQSLSGILSGQEGVKVVSKPGAAFSYAGGNYTLLQLLIEEVSGRSFSDYMKDEILLPLGMENSSFEWDRHLRDKIARAYDVLGNPVPNYLFTEKAAAGLYSTAEDFSKFLIACLGGPENTECGSNILECDVVSEMFKPGIEGYGLGFLIKEIGDGTKFIFHGGTNRGWRSQFILLPERNEGIVVLTNSDRGEHLFSDISIMWIEKKTGYVPGHYYANVIIPRIITWSVGIIFALLLVIFIVRFVINIKSKKYGFILDLIKHRLSKVIVHGLLVLGIIAFTSLWFIAFYTGVVYHGWIIAGEMPYGFQMISVMILLWSIALMSRFLFYKIKNK